MKQTRNLLLTGAMALVAGVFSACGGGNSAEAEAAAMPTDGILGELPKVVAEYEAAETAASAKYDEMKKSNPDKAREFWTEYINQGNTTKFKKETLPAVEKTLEGKEIPTEVAEELPLKLEKNFTLNDKRDATTTALLTADANQQTPVMNYTPVAFDADGNAIATGRSTNWQSLYPIKEGKQMSFRLFISVSDYDAARWARLQKIVIMDNKSDAYKQAEEQIKANKDAFKNKGKE
ncbi:MAG: hypothetical protein IKP33_02520 [Prevotella sp.]|jgi:hypothetical protein|nr:hypothetical protein [Prevotella sp.]